MENPITDHDYRLKLVQSLTLFDDIFFSAVLQYSDSCQEVLRVFTGIEDLVVTEVTTQKNIRGAAGHSVILDMLASDSKGKLYDIEVQLKQEEGYTQRLRYYAAMVDSSFLETGERYEQLPELFQITLSKKDYFKGGQAKYEVVRLIRELDRELENGIHEIYINAENLDDSAVSQLAQFFQSLETEHPSFPALSKRIQQYKVEEEGTKSMSELIEAYAAEKEQNAWAAGEAKGRVAGRAEGEAKGWAKGRTEEKRAMVYAAFQSGIPIPTIAQFSKLSEQKVREIIASKQEK